MSSGLLAFKLSTPITEPAPADETAQWRGTDRAEAGCYCTTRGYHGYCRAYYSGSSMTCSEWGWGTLECYCYGY
jgi:hypothetical protein